MGLLLLRGVGLGSAYTVAGEGAKTVGQLRLPLEYALFTDGVGTFGVGDLGNGCCCGGKGVLTLVLKHDVEAPMYAC